MLSGDGGGIDFICYGIGESKRMIFTLSREKAVEATIMLEHHEALSISSNMSPKRLFNLRPKINVEEDFYSKSHKFIRSFKALSNLTRTELSTSMNK